MCGRFTLTVDPAELREIFPDLKIPDHIQPRYNIAPTQPVAVIANTGKFELDYFRWGLVPSWAKDPEIGNRLINARGETLAEKPSFRSVYRRKRCLILADGFYEWQQQPGLKKKIPFYIHLKDHKPFAFAGLWDLWFAPDGSEVYSCAIITAQPNELIQPIHNRMPVILPEAARMAWLASEEKSPKVLDPFIRSYPAADMTAYPVSSLVNSPNNDLAECIQPAMHL